mgnify:CR=1 FL=1
MSKLAKRTAFINGVSVEETKIIAPDSFSPNGDGESDTWELPFLRYYKDYNVIITNVWGEEIVKLTEGQTSWDGNKDGEPVLAGIYSYMMNLNGDSKEVKGSFELIRP